MKYHFDPTRLHYLILLSGSSLIGGAERQAMMLASYLRKNLDARVTCLALAGGAQLRDAFSQMGCGVNVIPLHFYSHRVIKAFKYLKIIKFFKNNGVDVVIPFVAEQNRVAAATWKYGGAQVAFWNQREEGRKLFGTPSEKKALQSVSVIVSNSWEGRDFLVRTYGLNPDAVHIINNGIHLPPMDSVRSQIWRHRFDVSPQDPMICMVANLSHRKDHFTLLKAWREFLNHYRGDGAPRLLLVGDPRNTTRDLKVLAFDLNLSGSVIFTGFIEDVSSLIAECDFAVHSSYLEGCPNGILECMAMGKAVIATDISGARQALGNRWSEFVFAPKDDHNALASNLVHLIENPGFSHEIGRHNRKRIEDFFSIERMGGTYAEFVKKCVTKGPVAQ